MPRSGSVEPTATARLGATCRQRLCAHYERLAGVAAHARASGLAFRLGTARSTSGSNLLDRDYFLSDPTTIKV